MESIWSMTCGPAAGAQREPGPCVVGERDTLYKRDTLRKDITTEVAVIGAGMAGILTAYQLQKAGRQVVVLEADRIAGGQTRNTTAKITAQHGLIFYRLLKRFGKERAALYAEANLKALDEYRRIIKEEKIDCDLEEKYSCIYSDNKERLQREAEAAAAIGLHASYIRDVPLPVSCAGGVRLERQAQFHPLKFIRAVAGGLTVYEHTPVRRMDGNTLETDGGRVKADRVVFACHYPFVNFPGMYFARMHQERSYVLALKNVDRLDGMFLGEGENAWSFRSYGDILLFGGEDHRTGESVEGDRYRRLREKAHQLYPSCREVAHWSAQDCMTPDHVPYIGRYSSDRPDWYVATGFLKWGMTTSMVSAMLIKDLICGRENPCAGVFTPQRFSAGDIPPIACEGGHSVKGLAKRSLSSPSMTVEELPPGHGGIVRMNGEKTGVYKDREGKVYTVDIRCPHLGCQLEWNPDELSWDCPCHGSRFDYHGRLIDNPAQEGIAHE